MSASPNIEPCFLCNAPARCEATAHGHRRRYLCSSARCGEFEVSLAAMKELESNLRFKLTASQIAAGVSAPDKILEIKLVDLPEQRVNVQVVDRR